MNCAPSKKEIMEEVALNSFRSSTKNIPNERPEPLTVIIIATLAGKEIKKYYFAAILKAIQKHDHEIVEQHVILSNNYNTVITTNLITTVQRLILMLKGGGIRY